MRARQGRHVTPGVSLQASLAFGQVDVCLIPEVKFRLEGEGGLLAYVQQVLDSKGHAVICVSEGAGLVSRQLVAWLVATAGSRGVCWQGACCGAC